MRLADLRVDPLNGLVYAKLSGEVDLSNASELRDRLREMTPNTALGLLLDLSDVDYLDSAGIHLIHHLREELRSRGQKLGLVIPAESPINHTLRLAGLDWTEDIAETVAEAREALGPSADG